MPPQDNRHMLWVRISGVSYNNVGRKVMWHQKYTVQSFRGWHPFLNMACICSLSTPTPSFWIAKGKMMSLEFCHTKHTQCWFSKMPSFSHLGCFSMAAVRWGRSAHGEPRGCEERMTDVSLWDWWDLHLTIDSGIKARYASARWIFIDMCCQYLSWALIFLYLEGKDLQNSWTEYLELLIPW